MVKNLSLLDVFTTAALKFGDILHPLNKYDIYMEVKVFEGD